MENIDFLLVMEGEMDFGFAVSDYTLQVGSYGDLIKLNIKDMYPHSIVWVQGENAAGGKSAIVTTGVTLGVLVGYMEDDSCPDIAWSLNGVELTIFFKHDAYDTRFAYQEKRNALPVLELTDYIDVPEELIPLYRLYVMKSIQNLKGYIGNKVSDLISAEEAKFTTA